MAKAFAAVEIPVLARTLAELAKLRKDEDRLTSRDVARVLQHDPMFCLRLLRHVQGMRGEGQNADIGTVEHALMMLGIARFFERFRDLPTVEERLRDSPAALAGLLRVLSRAHHAALHARDWADIRRDSAANEVAVAALLHDLAEMLLWCFEPGRALRIQALQRADPALRASVAQRAVLGFRLEELQAVLVDEWNLGELLRILTARRIETPRSINATLAVDLARHAANGWDNPALPDDYKAIGQLLKLKHDEVLPVVERTARQALQAWDWFLPGTLRGRPAAAQDSATADDN